MAALRTEFDAGAVQVVFLDLAGLPSAPPTGILTAEEEARARALVALPVRRGFIGGRWLVRSMLGGLTGIEPQGLQIEAGAHGKLFLAGHERDGPCFNLSHSRDLAGVALIRDRRVGIDIEAERPLADPALLARRILGPRERARFEALPERAHEAALLAAWTRKEAVLKAVGTGISGTLRSIDVLADAGDDAAVHGAEPSTAWSLCRLSMPSGYQGAVAVEGDARRLIAWQAVLSQS